jgi:catechol 2,3-dioxygenase-like lactoylglutathione lyase family enzyme
MRPSGFARQGGDRCARPGRLGYLAPVASVRLQSLVLYSRRPRPLAEHYARVLDLPLAWRGEMPWLDLEGVELAFARGASLPASGEAPTPWFSVPDLFAAVARAREAGATERLAPERREGALLAAFRDPDGNVYGLRQAGT